MLIFEKMLNELINFTDPLFWFHLTDKVRIILMIYG